MKYKYLTPFKQDEYEFSGAHCFMVKDKSFLLSENGVSIVLDNNLISDIEKCKLSEELAFKLYQRGFGSVYEQERLKVPENLICPTLFMIDFTTKCNCNCVYCLRHFEDAGETISDEMLEKIAKYIIQYCKSNDIQRISFQPWGGEPLIALKQIIDCKKLFEEAGVRADFIIQTNGLLLTLDNYEKLRSNNIAVGVSIDGIESVHDAHRLDVRGNRTHAAIVRNLKIIHEKYPNDNIGSLSVNSMFSRDHVAENVNYLVNELGFHSIKFNLVHPSGAEGFDDNILLKKNDIAQYVRDLIDAVVNCIDSGKTCIETNIFDKLGNLLDHADRNICNSRGCRGGLSFISFDQQGNIYPCEMIGHTEYCLGSVLDEYNDLTTLINEAQTKNDYYAQRDLNSCNGCPFIYFCRGGCKASCLAYGKKTCDVDQMECALNQSLYPILIELILTKPHVVEQLMGKRVEIGW